MPDRFSDRSPDHSSDDELRAHATFRAAQSANGIGVAVARSGARDGGQFWDCLVSDGQEWHFVQVLGAGLGSFTGLVPEDIEAGIEHFAATLPESYRLRALVNANPLHIDRNGTVRAA